MFQGEYVHAIDDKNRLTLPAKLRPALAAGVVLTRGLEKNIDVYPRDSWDASTARIAGLDQLTREGRAMKRFVFASAAVVEPDRQGRVLIPPHLVGHAGLDKEVVLAGVSDHLEIWDRSEWEAQLSEMEGSAGDVAERLAAQSG
jgi:transcriptional regulator MraZ